MSFAIEKTRKGARNREIYITPELWRMLKNIADVLELPCVEDAAEVLLQQKIAQDYPEIDQAFAFMAMAKAEREAQEDKRLSEARDKIKERIAESLANDPEDRTTENCERCSDPFVPLFHDTLCPKCAKEIDGNS